MTADRYDLKHDQLYTRLLQVLSALPVIESRRDTVGDVAAYLCDAFFSPPHDFYPITKQDERDLRELRKRANALRVHLAKVDGIALTAVGIERACLPQLIRMEARAERALEQLRAPPGAPRKQRADTIATAAAEVFERLTGTRSTLRYSEGVAYGPFHDFLEAIFEACKIAASAEAQAKAVRRKRRPPQSEGVMEKTPQKLELTPFDASLSLCVSVHGRKQP